MKTDLPTPTPPSLSAHAGDRSLNGDGKPGRLSVAGLAVLLVSSAGFGLVAQQVVSQGPLVEVDRRFDEELPQNLKTAPYTGFFVRVSECGAEPTMIALGVGVSIGLLAMRKWRLALALAVAAVAGVKLNLLLKNGFHVARPPLAGKPTYGFPSGHAMGSLIVYGLVVYLLSLNLLRRWWDRALVAGLLAALVLLIGFSRMYLHAHYFSQVLGGFTAGAAWLALCLTAVEAVRRRCA